MVRWDINTSLTITVTLNSHQMPKQYSTSYLKDTFPVQFPDTKIIPTTETGIKYIIYSLNTKN
jgi:hypothetical protein